MPEKADVVRLFKAVDTVEPNAGAVGAAAGVPAAVATEPALTLTDAGLEAFEAYLSDPDDARSIAGPFRILQDPALARPLADLRFPKQEVYRDAFAFGTAVVAALGAPACRARMNDTGLWTALSIRFFDTVCPIDLRRGLRRIRKDAYLFNSGRRQRHLAQLAARVALYHGKAPHLARFLLAAPPWERGHALAEFASRPSLLEHAGAVEAAWRLYWDMHENRFVSGATARQIGARGTVARFCVEATGLLKDGALKDAPWQAVIAELQQLDEFNEFITRMRARALVVTAGRLKRSAQMSIWGDGAGED